MKYCAPWFLCQFMSASNDHGGYLTLFPHCTILVKISRKRFFQQNFNLKMTRIQRGVKSWMLLDALLRLFHCWEGSAWRMLCQQCNAKLWTWSCQNDTKLRIWRPRKHSYISDVCDECAKIHPWRTRGRIQTWDIFADPVRLVLWPIMFSRRDKLFFFFFFFSFWF
jgi:hypothetical protein